MSVLYYDFTSSSKWKGNPTGIARVVNNVGINLSKHVESFQGCVYDSINGFRKYDFRTNEIGDNILVSKKSVLVSAGHNWDYDKYNEWVEQLKNTGVRVGTFFHDTIPIQFPYFYGPGFSDVYFKWLYHSLRISDFCYANSKCTQQDVWNFCQVHNIIKPPTEVIRLGDEIERESGDEKQVSSEFRELNRYILSVGTLEYRKNHIALLNAYRLLVAEGKSDLPILVIVGREGWLNNSVQFQVAHDPILKERVKIFSDVADQDLDYLYKHCLFMVFPAIYEGWGLPVAESLRYGKQCITSNTSSMVEIAPHLTRFAHPLKPDEWARQIYELYSNAAILQQETVRVQSEYIGTSWNDTAEQISKVINRYL